MGGMASVLSHFSAPFPYFRKSPVMSIPGISSTAATEITSLFQEGLVKTFPVINPIEGHGIANSNIRR
jgi:hypothetical protein